EQNEKKLSPFASTKELSEQAQGLLNLHALMSEDEQVNGSIIIESDLLIEDEEVNDSILVDVDLLSENEDDTDTLHPSLMTELTVVTDLSDEQLEVQEESKVVQPDIKVSTEHDEQQMLVSQFQQLSEQVLSLLNDLDEENIKQLS